MSTVRAINFQHPSASAAAIALNSDGTIGNSSFANYPGCNALINGSMMIWQRGTSTAGSTGGTTGYAADRWQVGRAGLASGLTASRQDTNDATNLPFIQYCLRIQRDSGNTSNSTLYLSQSLENINSKRLIGRQVTLSFYARVSATFSGSIFSQIFSGTGTDQNAYTNGLTGSQNNTINHNATTTWQRFSNTWTVPSNASQVAVFIASSVSGTAGASDYFEVTGIQLEVGSIATPFECKSYGEELRECQRYYWRMQGNTNIAPCSAWTSAEATVVINNPVPMRSDTINVGFSGNANFYIASAIKTSTSLTTNSTNIYQIMMKHSSFSGMSAGTAGWFGIGGTGSYIDASCEL